MKKIKNEDELFIPKDRLFIKIFIFLFIVLALIGAGYYYYKNYYSNPQKIVDKIIEKVEKRISNVKETEYKLYKINGLLNIKLDLGNELKDITNIINSISLQVNSEHDETNNISNIDINTKYKDDKLFNINLYHENSVDYLYLEDLYNRYIKLGDEVIKTKNISKNDAQNIVNGFFNAIKESLKEQTFERKEDTITINNKKIEVNNNYLSLSENQINNFLISILNTLINDTNFINSLNNIAGRDEKQILQTLINNLKEDTITGSYKLSFYTKKALKQELVSIRQELNIDNQKTYFDIDLIDENNLLINISDGEETLELKLYEKENAFNVEINIKVIDKKIGLFFKGNIEEIKEVSKQNVSNSVKIEELTDEDANRIQENLQKNETLLKLIDELSKIMKSNKV